MKREIRPRLSSSGSTPRFTSTSTWNTCSNIKAIRVIRYNSCNQSIAQSEKQISVIRDAGLDIKAYGRIRTSIPTSPQNGEESGSEKTETFGIMKNDQITTTVQKSSPYWGSKIGQNSQTYSTVNNCESHLDAISIS